MTLIILALKASNPLRPADIEQLKNIIKTLHSIDFTAKEKKSYAMMYIIDAADNRISDNIRLMTIEFNKILSLAQTIQ
jgi:hypothetical protein